MYIAPSALQMKHCSNQRRSLALHQQRGFILAEINKYEGKEDKEKGMNRHAPEVGFTHPSQETALSWHYEGERQRERWPGGWQAGK